MPPVRACALGLVVLFGCAEGGTFSGGGSPDGGGTTTLNSSGGNATGGDPSSGGSGGENVVQGGAADGGASAGGGDAEGGAGGAGGGPIEQACPTNQFATGFDDAGVIQCAPLDESVLTAVNQGCSLYLGIRDNCGSCSTAPAKWGKVSGAACQNGVGVDNTCAPATFGATQVQMFGLNLDGDVDENDKLYAAFTCNAPVFGETPGPCAAGQFVSSRSGGAVGCTAASAAILEYTRGACSFYVGWRDECDSCNFAPTKWGFANSLACNVGSGAGNTCLPTTLGVDTVPLFGLDLDGNMDDNDKLYFGLECQAAVAEGGPQPSACPQGQLLVGTHGDGTVECESPRAVIANLVKDRCRLYAGWRDSCNACTTQPAKYGRAGEGFCANDAGVNNTCQAVSLAGTQVDLFGLNTDGDVDDDDKIHVGLECN